MLHRSALTLIAIVAIACTPTNDVPDAAMTDGGPPRDSGPRIDTSVDAGPMPDAFSTAPHAELVPAPPLYWYVDISPLSLVVGGSNVTQYRSRIDTGPWSADTPIATALVLGGVRAGWHTLELVGGDAAAHWQPDASATSHRFFMATTGREPIACMDRAHGGQCDLVIPATPDDYQYWASATADPARYGFETLFDAPAGATICISAGTTRAISFRGVEGNEGAPYTFTNCGGVARIALHAGDPGGRVALQFSGSHHLRIVGVGSSEEHGFVIASGGTTAGNHAIEMREGCSDYEIAFVEVESSDYGGIVARTDVTCTHNRDTFVQANTFLHDDFVHDTAGEGFYIGGSHWNATMRLAAGEIGCGDFGTGTMDCSGTCAFEPELHGVRVYRNRVERTDADGIQLSSARGDHDGPSDWDTEVFGNVVIDPATGPSPYNSGGMTIQAGCTGRVHHNYVQGSGAYAGIFLSGIGHFVFYDNIIVGSAHTGIAMQDNDAGALNGPFVIVGNTIVNTVEEGVYMYHEHSVGNFFVGNLVVGAMLMPVRLNSTHVDWTATSNVTTGTAAEHFADMGETGFHLRATSSAVDHGEDLASYGVTDDHHHAARVAPFDIGAVVGP